MVESPKSDARLFVGDSENGFRASDLVAGEMEPVPYESDYGKPVKIVDVGGGSGLVVLCYTSMSRVAVCPRVYLWCLHVTRSSPA